MTDTATPATIPACKGFADACGAPAGQPCAPGCPSQASDEYADAEFAGVSAATPAGTDSWDAARLYSDDGTPA